MSLNPMVGWTMSHMIGGAHESGNSAGFIAHEVTGESLLALKSRVLWTLQDMFCISGHEQLRPPNKGAFFSCHLP